MTKQEAIERAATKWVDRAGGDVTIRRRSFCGLCFKYMDGLNWNSMWSCRHCPIVKCEGNTCASMIESAEKSNKPYFDLAIAVYLWSLCMPRPMKTGQPYEAWEIDYIVDAYFKRWPLVRIAKRLRRTEAGVRRFAQRVSIKRRKG